jgi:hypothetical protein
MSFTPQTESGRCEEKNLLPFPGIEPRLSSPQPVVLPTELPRLLGDIDSHTKFLIPYETVTSYSASSLFNDAASV